MTNLHQKTVSASRWSALEVFVRTGIQFLVSIILARILAPEEFGIFAMLALFIGLAGVFIDGGFSSAVIQRQNITLADESTVFYVNLFLGFSVASTLYLCAPWIASFYEQPLLEPLTIAMAASLFVGSLGSIHTSILNKVMNFKILAKIGTASSVAGGAVAIYMASSGFGVWSLAISSLVTTLVSVLLLWIWHPWRPALMFSFRSLRRFFRFGGYEMGSRLTDVLATNLHLLLLGKIYSARDLGLYGRAQSTQQLPANLMMGIMNRVAFASFASVHDDKARLVRGLRQAQAISMLINTPIMVGVILLAKPLVLTLFGEQWLASVPILQVLGMCGILWPMHVLNLNVLRAQGRSDLNFNLAIFKKTISIALTISASFYGVMAIAWTQVLISILGYFANTYYTKALLGYGGTQQLRDLAAIFVAIIPMAAAIYTMSERLQWSPMLVLVGNSILGLAIYALTCRILCKDLLVQSLNLIGFKLAASRSDHAK